MVFSELPEEIIEQVILRVQCVKSIVRCMSVCRSWYGLIKSGYFINMHLSHPSKTKYLFCNHGMPPCHGGGCSHYYWLRSDNEAFHEYSPVDHPDKSINEAHGCNGLICYEKANSKRLCLWNPAIRKLKVVPASPQVDRRNRYKKCIRIFKLWFDSKANDYRILRIIVNVRKATLVEFYSLKTNSWTLISENASVTSSGIYECTYLNGIWYWLDYADDVTTLISLDTEKWMFGKVLTWQIALNRTAWGIGPTYLMPVDDRCLVIVGYYHLNVFLQWRWRFTVVYDQSWNKFYTIDFQHEIDGWVPIGVRNNSEILLQNKNYKATNLEIVSWNLKACRINGFVPVYSHTIREVSPYIQSLALLNDADTTSVCDDAAPIRRTRKQVFSKKTL